MFILLLIILLIAAVLVLILCFRWLKRVLNSKPRIIVFLSVLASVGLGVVIHHFFFKNMHIIQSKVYPNLYLIKYPDKDYAAVEKAIKDKIVTHLQTEHTKGKPLAYTNENGIYFYEYGGQVYGFLGDAGTSYFIDNEEDLGGFVTEELGMYTQYRLAEFYYEPCSQDASLYCGEINFFKEGEVTKVDTLSNLVVVDSNIRPAKPTQNTRNATGIEEPKPMEEDGTKNEDPKLPVHGALDNQQMATFYPNLMNEFGKNSVFYAQNIPLSGSAEVIASLVQCSNSTTSYLLYTHSKKLEVIDSFYIGEATDFDSGKSQTIDYTITQDSTLIVNKIIWGLTEINNEESIDTLAHEIVKARVTEKGNIAYSFAKNPAYYVVTVFDDDADPNGIHLRDAPNGNIVTTLKPPAYGYMFSIVPGEKEWFRVLMVEEVDQGEIKMPQGIAWIHASVIGIRTQEETPIFDTPKKGKQLGSIPADQDLKMTDIHRNWIKIAHQGSVGWVQAEKLCGNPVTTCP